jgi:hypothetical protein
MQFSVSLKLPDSPDDPLCSPQKTVAIHLPLELQEATLGRSRPLRF